jgi:hypothetical protein
MIDTNTVPVAPPRPPIIAAPPATPGPGSPQDEPRDPTGPGPASPVPPDILPPHNIHDPDPADQSIPVREPSSMPPPPQRAAARHGKPLLLH